MQHPRRTGPRAGLSKSELRRAHQSKNNKRAYSPDLLDDSDSENSSSALAGGSSSAAIMQVLNTHSSEEGNGVSTVLQAMALVSDRSSSDTSPLNVDSGEESEEERFLGAPRGKRATYGLPSSGTLQQQIIWVYEEEAVSEAQSSAPVDEMDSQASGYLPTDEVSGGTSGSSQYEDSQDSRGFTSSSASDDGNVLPGVSLFAATENVRDAFSTPLDQIIGIGI